MLEVYRCIPKVAESTNILS